MNIIIHLWSAYIDIMEVLIDDLIINSNRSHLLLLLSQKTSIKKYILTNYHSNNTSKEIDFNNILQR